MYVLNHANKTKPSCRIRRKKVKSPRCLRLENNVKEVHLFDEEYTTKREKNQPKIMTKMNGKGLTVHAGLLPVLTFMEKLLFRKRAQAVRE